MKKILVFARVWCNVAGRSEPRRVVLVPYYMSAINLSIFRFDSQRQIPKHHVRNHLIDVSKAYESPPLDGTGSIIDTMSVMRANENKETFKEWFKTVKKFTLPGSSEKPLSIEYVNDVYRGINAESCYRDKRGQSETGLHLQSLEQKTLSNKEWLAYFHNIKNQQQLFFSQLVTYLQADDFVQSSPLPVMVNSNNETFNISFECNHKEDDSKDTNNFVLMIFVYALNKINQKQLGYEN